MPKSDGIDLMKLRSTFTSEKWNKYLTKCHGSHNSKELYTMMNRLQVGMDKLVRDKMNTDEMCTFFLRLQRSCENTLKKIWREQNKHPNYNPNTADPKYIEEKRRLDNEFERRLRKASF